MKILLKVASEESVPTFVTLFRDAGVQAAHFSTGRVTVEDVQAAAREQAVLLGYNTWMNEGVVELATELGVPLHFYRTISDLLVALASKQLTNKQLLQSEAKNC